jgi:hypothetical protein
MAANIQEHFASKTWFRENSALTVSPLLSLAPKSYDIPTTILVPLGRERSNQLLYGLLLNSVSKFFYIISFAARFIFYFLERLNHFSPFFPN